MSVAWLLWPSGNFISSPDTVFSVPRRQPTSAGMMGDTEGQKECDFIIQPQHHVGLSVVVVGGAGMAKEIEPTQPGNRMSTI